MCYVHGPCITGTSPPGGREHACCATPAVQGDPSELVGRSCGCFPAEAGDPSVRANHVSVVTVQLITAGHRTNVRPRVHYVRLVVLVRLTNGRTNCRRLLTPGTFDKWQKQHENEHQTVSWLCCDLAIAIARPYSNQRLSCYALAIV